MEILLASTPDSDFYMKLMISLIFLGGAIKLARDIFKKNPAYNELATKDAVDNKLEKYVRKEEFKTFETRVEGDMKEIKAMISETNDLVKDYAEKSYEARRRIHNNVNEIDRKVVELNTKQEEQGKLVRQITTTKNG